LITTVNFTEEPSQLIKMVVHHSALALRQYFRMHLSLMCDQVKRKLARTSRDQPPPLPAPAYKATQIDTHTTNANISFVEKNYPAFLAAAQKWHPIELFMKYEAVQTFLHLAKIGQEWEMQDLVRLIFETFQVISLLPATQYTLAVNTIPPLVPPEEGVAVVNESGLAIMLNLLDAKSGTGSDPDIRLSILQVMTNLVCRQIVHRRRPSNPPKPITPITPGPPGGLASASAVTTLLLGAGGVGMADRGDGKGTSDELARAVWQSVRSNHGIKVLLSLLRTTTPVTRADEIRTVACKALLGLSRSGMVKQILGKLQVSQLLSELVREPLLEDNAAIHSQFKQYAVLLIRSTTGKDTQALFATDDVTDPAAKKLERAAIVASTEIQYPEDELLTIIYKHLRSCGLTQSAEALFKEAHLKPASVVVQASAAGSSSSTAPSLPGQPPQPPPLPPLKTPVRHSTLATALSTSKTPSAPAWVKQVDSFDPMADMALPPPENTLETIVTQFLRDQHAHCVNPVAVLPPFSLLTPHRCPEPRHLELAPSNVTSRLFQRQLQPPVGGFGGARMTRRLIYSRFRYLRAFRDEEAMITSASFLGLGGDRLVAGTHTGDVKIFDVGSGQVLSSNGCHDAPIWAVTPSANHRLLLTSLFDGHSAASALWSLSDLSDARHVFDDDLALLFSAGNDRLVGTSPEAVARIYSTETGQAIVTLSDPSSNHYENNVACFNLTDDLVVNDGILWDPRVPKKIHRFDKFSNYACSKFHPNGLEIIVNSEIWDMRTFKLLRTCQALDQTQITFNSHRDIIYGWVPLFSSSSRRV